MNAFATLLFSDLLVAVLLASRSSQKNPTELKSVEVKKAGTFCLFYLMHYGPFPLKKLEKLSVCLVVLQKLAHFWSKMTHCEAAQKKWRCSLRFFARLREQTHRCYLK